MAKRILIVDNEKSICDTLELLLTYEGYEIFKAYEGNEALKRMYTVSPDLVILDLYMPGISGFIVCEKIRMDQFYKNIPILMMTAIGSKDNEKKSKDVGVDYFMPKPFNNIDLVGKIKELLDIEKTI